MSENRTGKQGSRDNSELSRVAAKYLAGDISREQLCRSVDRKQTTPAGVPTRPRAAETVKT